MEVRSFVGVGIDERDVSKILSHNGMELEGDRYPSHVTLITPEETSTVTEVYGNKSLQNAIKRT
jgi:hypothetical protein